MLNERPLLSLLDSEVQTLKISDPVNFFAQYGRGGQGFLSPRPLTLNKCVVDIFAIIQCDVGEGSQLAPSADTATWQSWLERWGPNEEQAIHRVP